MLERTIDDFEIRSGLRVEFSMATGLPATLAPRVQVELLRIVSEALTNVRKHADATTVRIAAEVSDGELLITVTDNGHGFVQEEAFDQGMGLRGMRERARLIGGSLLVMSELSGGTTVEVRAPLMAPGVGSVSETSERTPMAPDHGAEDEAIELGLPEAGPEPLAPGSAVLSSMRGVANGPDINPKVVQP
jgi:signal transduction histidine kinase